MGLMVASGTKVDSQGSQLCVFALHLPFFASTASLWSFSVLSVFQIYTSVQSMGGASRRRRLKAGERTRHIYSTTAFMVLFFCLFVFFNMAAFLYSKSLGEVFFSQASTFTWP